MQPLTKTSHTFQGQEADELHDSDAREPEALSDWCVLVPRMLHPIKVAILEALRWIGRPLSAVELKGILEGDQPTSLVSYHLRNLAEHGVVVQTSERQVRGALQKFYFFPADLRTTSPR